MPNLFALILCLIFVGEYSLQAQCGDRYKQRHFSNIQIFRDVVYSQNAPSLVAATLTTETIVNKDLVMDVFMPPVYDTVQARPVVILAHGGGFINIAFMGGTSLVGTMDNDDVQALADTLAHWGYVAAVIEYRLGFNVLSNSSIKRAVWRATQDMSAAIRFFRKNYQWFSIDPQRVVAAGSSAGAFCALHSTFVDYTERMPESYQLVPLLKPDLGPLHSRPIVELTGFNPFAGQSVLGADVDSIANAVVAYWGAIADLSWINQGGHHAPTILFHGTNDMVVDYQCAKPFSSVILVAPVTCGSYAIDSVLDLQGIRHEAHYATGENHEYWGVLNGNWTLSGPNAYWPDIIQKSANFLYDLMQPLPPLCIGPSTAATAVNYTYTLSNPQNNYRYCWQVDGGVVVSANTDSSTVDVQFYGGFNSARVAVSAIDAAGFVSDSSQLFVQLAATSTIKLSKQAIEVQLYPNPVQTALKVQAHTIGGQFYKLQVINMTGKVVYQQTITNSGLNAGIKLDLSWIPKGIYCLKIANDKQCSLNKFNKI